MSGLTRRCTAVAAILLLCTTTLFAQTAPITAGETIDVSLINVDVFVTDAEGNRVRGLTRDDFEIYENGVRQEISNFAEYAGGDERVDVESGATATPAAAEEAAPRQKRNLLIFVERMRLPNFSAEPLVAELKSLVRRTIGSGDAVSIVIWSRFEGTDHLEFTGDLEKVDARLDLLADELQRVYIDHTGALRDEAAMLRRFESDAGSMPGNPTTTSLTLAMLVAYGEMKVRINAINSAINTMAGLEGKKAMLIAARRLGAVAGAEFAYSHGLSLLPYELRSRYGTESLMRTVTEMANASGVTLYPIYPIKLTSPMPDAGASEPASAIVDDMTYQNELIAQQQIARATGGLAAASTVDVIRLLPRISDDITDYYSLAYRIAPTGKDVARDIVVKTKNPRLSVRARRQFIEKSEETRMRDRLRATFFRAAAEDDSQIDIEATVGPRKRRGTSTVPLRVRIPVADLTMLPQAGGKHAGSFSVYVGAAGDLDELSDITRKTQPFDVPEAQLEQARASYFTYDLDVTVNPKAKYVAVGVLDDVGRSYGVLRLPLEQAQ